MNLHSYNTASHILLLESVVPFSIELVDVLQGFPAEFLHLNPKGKMPFLHMDGKTIT
jgi:glutathione S-transferase